MPWKTADLGYAGPGQVGHSYFSKASVNYVPVTAPFSSAVSDLVKPLSDPETL